MKLPFTAAWYPLPLFCLLLLGACQRAAYHFQATPQASYLASPAPAMALASPPSDGAPPVVATPAARVAPARQRRRRWHVLRKEVAGRAAMARPRPVVAATPRLRVVYPAAFQAAGQPVRHRSKGIALLLLVGGFVLLGPVGLHNFYLGRPELGVLGIVGTYFSIFLVLIGALGAAGGTTGAAAVVGTIGLAALVIWQISDLVRIITGDLKPRNGEFNPRLFQTRPDLPAAVTLPTSPR